MSVAIHHGDCRDVLDTLEAESVHAVVTDPPYHLTNLVPDVKWCAACRRVLGGSDGRPGACPRCGGALERQRSKGGKGFMGQKWDGGDVAFDPETWRKVLRVMKPGAYLLAFGGTRTYHRLACAIEDAGFEIRDMISWLYGSGFPKGTDKAKIPEGWQGFNTALKPAQEPICLARKPMIGSLAANLQAWGCGALNVGGCRIEHETVEGGSLAINTHLRDGVRRGEGDSIFGMGAEDRYEIPAGRWPANVVHDGSEEVLEHFPEAPGQMGNVSGDEPSVPAKNVYGTFGRSPASTLRGDSGSAARFFYCAKADREDRNDGLHGMTAKALNWSSGEQNPGSFQSPNTNRSAQNHHPTVKPTDLMVWLCKLVTPPGGVILDPFMGSGSTGRGAALGDFKFIGIEREAEYVEIARRRIRAIAPLFIAA